MLVTKNRRHFGVIEGLSLRFLVTHKPVMYARRSII